MQGSVVEPKRLRWRLCAAQNWEVFRSDSFDCKSVRDREVGLSILSPAKASNTNLGEASN